MGRDDPKDDGGGAVLTNGIEDQTLQEKKNNNNNKDDNVVVLKLDVSGVDPPFDLEKAVCSHGLFMMAPNRWDPETKTFQRPLRVSSRSSLLVRISQPDPSPSPLLVSIFAPATSSISLDQQQTLLGQVRRMLRLSDEEDTIVREFHKIHPQARENGFGRIFRSPTLFEDMVKCILLCNCQWSRTLSMAQALCDLQLELGSCTSSENLSPKTPKKRELKRKRVKKDHVPTKLAIMFVDNELETPITGSLSKDHFDIMDLPLEDATKSTATAYKSGLLDLCTTCEVSHLHGNFGNFPSPEELAVLDEKLLADCCKLGYRAKRIVSLAKSVVGGQLHLEELEKICVLTKTSSYDTLHQRLLAIDGFGPFTSANILVCMGFYHKIPSDSETIRHLKQFHARSSTTQTVQELVKEMYKIYNPFQFLAYWFELWGFYEKRFGKTSEMPVSNYRLITANNMKVIKSR